MTELEEEHGGEEGVFADLDKINKATVAARLLELLAESGQTAARARQVAEAAVPFGDQPDSDANVLLTWLNLHNREADRKKKLNDAEVKLDKLAYEKYPELTEAEVKTLVVDDKWLATLDVTIHGEMDRISQNLTLRVKELAERYETPLPQMAKTVAELEAKVNRHLQKMGFSWK